MERIVGGGENHHRQITTTYFSAINHINMKQVININFQGHVISIEVTAFEKVKHYIETLKKHFAQEEGGDEIINDIEGRIGELFHERIKSGASCITDSEVEEVIASIGRPEQFDTSEKNSAEENAGKESFTADAPRPRKLYRNEAEKLLGGICSGLADYLNIDVVIVRIVCLIFLGPLILPYIILWIVLPGSSVQSMGSPKKKLFRDPDEKIIAGVCSGLGKYFGVDPWIPRIIFLLPLLSFLFSWDNHMFLFPGLFRFTLSPGSLTIYLILWLVIPRARTISEKLQMRGEKVDLNTLQGMVGRGARDFEQKAEKWGKEFSATVQQQAQNVKGEVYEMAGKGKKGIGRILFGILKAIIYIIIGFAAFVAFIIIFSLSLAAVSVFPLRDFVINDGWQNMLAWSTIILFFLVPLTGSVIWIVRRISRSKRHSGALRITFASLWFIGLLSGAMLVVSVAKDFSNRSISKPVEITLANPSSQTLHITPLSPSSHIKRFENNTIVSFGDVFFVDTIPINSVKFNQRISPNDSFRVFVSKSSLGRNKADAANRASAINPAFESYDSTLAIDPRILITRKDKFRNQRLEIDIYVPRGRKVIIDEGFDEFDVETDNPGNHKKESLQPGNIM